ncbi:Cullin binding-domain-containing protein, partial [Pavlovales sp. CCMP2436]
VLVFAWQLEAARMGYFTRAEWTSGLAKLRATSLEEVKSKLESLHADTLKAAKMHGGNHESFRNFYAFAHKYCRDDNKKNLDTDTSCAMLAMILDPLYPRHVAQFTAYLGKINRMHGINQDEWSCFWELCRTVKDDCSNYTDDGAWPILLDEYADYVQTQ